jgi:hypothetical protein
VGSRLLSAFNQIENVHSMSILNGRVVASNETVKKILLFPVIYGK